MSEERSIPRDIERSGVPEDPETEERARCLLAGSRIQDASHRIRTTDDLTLAEQRELTEIPAPPFGERDRALRMADLMRASGLMGVELDSEGNVLGHLPGAGSGPPVILSAHLDTVFPSGTDVRVRQVGDRLVGPGIGDGPTLCGPARRPMPISIATTSAVAARTKGAKRLSRE